MGNALTRAAVAVFVLELAAGAVLTSSACGQSATNAASSAYVLKRVPPLSPEEALASFELADGFRIELVAAELLVMDPVAMAFDEHGRLYVVEMRDYSEQDKARLGRVRLLSDADGDGRFETSRVFVDGLSWPTAVACYDGGVFIGNAPDILYCKDTNGDGVADERRVAFTGFGRGNVQGLLNSFQWGLDGRIHGVTSSAGGEITRPDEKRAPLDLRGRDFAFDPKTLEIYAETGGGQHGMSFNRWGDRFVCHNSDHLQAIVFEERYISRNPFYSVVGARRPIAADGPQAAVYRISPIEAWRVARTKMRVAGQATGPIEGGGQPAGYFTSATGITVYEGGLWGAEDKAWVYIADVGSNLIHRKRLVPDGVTYRGERVDDHTEFVRSKDIWFRPVQMAVGPEGALYVADMYREVIEHPASLPPELKHQLDLTSGNDRGRIYRIVPADYKYSPPPNLAKAGAAELVQQLDHANAWRRTTAARLLYQRRDPSAASILRQQYSVSRRPEGRIAVLYALHAIGGLTAQDLVGALGDDHAQVRRHALALSESLLDSSDEVRAKALSLVNDSTAVVQFQLALSLGECRHTEADTALAEIVARHSDGADIVGAAMTSINGRAGAVLERLVKNERWIERPQAEPIVSAIAEQVMRQGRDDGIAALVRLLKSAQGNPSQTMRALLQALGRLPMETFRASNNSMLAELNRLRHSASDALVRDASQVITRENATLGERVAAIRTLGLDTFERHRQLFDELLAPQEPPEIHAAVLTTCTHFDAPEVAELVLSHWTSLGPNERTQATELLLRREPWALALVRHLAVEAIPLATFDPVHVARLENYPNEEVRQLVKELRGTAVAKDRKEVFQEYRDAALQEGNSANGKQVFEKNCASCHAVDAVGATVGPNLATMVSRGAESLLFNVLVPNGEVDPRYLEYVLLTVDGQVVSGIIAGETSSAVTIRSADNKNTTVLRVDIEELHNSGKSLMPEGFEKVIDKEAMSDLLTYLQQAAAIGETK